MLPVNISADGHLIDLVLKISIGGGIVIGIVSFAIVLYMIFKFRRSKNPFPLQDVPPLLKKVIYIDFAMIIFDLVLLVASSYAWAYFYIRPIDKIKKEALQKGENYVEVNVIGRQFFWTFIYPGEDGKFGTSDDFKLANVLVVPKNYYVFLKMTSGDTLHSLFIPNVRMKYDTIPGRTTYVWFKPTAEGQYDIACAELCGSMHYSMKGIMIVMEEEKYKEWIKNPIYNSEDIISMYEFKR